MSAIFSGITGIGALFGALRNVIQSIGSFLLLIGEQILNAVFFVLSGLTYLLANKKYLLLLIFAALATFLGFTFIFYTEDAINFIDQVWICALRPTAEWLLIYVIHFLRAAWEFISRYWNNVIRYVWEECLTVFWDDLTDWFDVFAGIVSGAATRFDAATTVGQKILSVVFDVGRGVTSIAELPFIVYSAFECTQYSWTMPRTLWALPVPTFQATGGVIPRYFPTQNVPQSPTNAPIGTPIPPPPLAPSGFDFWTSSAYEFNPRYGVYTNFIADNEWLDYVRRVAVSGQNAVYFSTRTLFTIIRTLRTPQLTEFWGSLIVSSRSEESLWGGIADSASHTAAVFITAFSVPDAILPNAFQCQPEGAGMNPEYSNMRFSAEGFIWSTNREIAEVLSAVSLILFDLTTSRVPGVPFYDWVAESVQIGAIDVNNNLFAREERFCELFVQEIQGESYANAVLKCPWWVDHAIPGVHFPGNCIPWGRISSSQYLQDPRYRISHWKVLWRALYDVVVGQIRRIITLFRAFTCNGFSETTGVGSLLIGLDTQFVRVRRVIDAIVDLLISTVYFLAAQRCAGTGSLPSLIVKGAKVLVYDLILNTIIPRGIAVVTSRDCINGQTVFECIVTQLALIDPFTEVICDAVNFLLDEVLGFIIDAINSAIGLINIVVGYLNDVITAVINELGKLFLAIAEVVATIGEDIGDCVGAVFTLGLTGDCDFDDGTSFSFTWTPKSIDDLAIPNIVFSLNLLMPCDETQYLADLAAFGPLKKRSDIERDLYAWIEENPDYNPKDANSDPFTVDVQKFVDMFYAHKQKKQQRSAFDGDERLKEKSQSKHNLAATLEFSKKMEDFSRTLKMSALAHDARIFYASVQKCYLGEDSGAPSQYSLCDEMEHLLLNQTHAQASVVDNGCIASRCLRVAQTCMEEHSAEHARVLGNPHKRNFFVNSWFAEIPQFFLNTFAYTSEAVMCYNASEVLRRDAEQPGTALRLGLGTMAWMYDTAKSVSYIGANYGTAYYDCLNSAQESVSKQIDERAELNVVEHFVHCLEEPYVADEARWRAPDNVDAITAWRAYMDEQDLTQRSNEACVHLLREHGLLFDTDGGDVREHARKAPSKLIAYRACAMAHAFGTRATLATAVWAEHGSQNINVLKMHERDAQKLWHAMPGKHMENFMSVWRAPVAMMRSASFLKTNMQSFVDAAVQRFGVWLANGYEMAARGMPRITRLLRKMLTQEYGGVAGFVRLVDVWADIYDEVLEPKDLLDRIHKRSDRRMIMPSERQALVSKWHKEAVHDAMQLVRYRSTHGKRSLSSSDDVTLAAFRRTGLYVARKRAVDVRGDGNTPREWNEVFDGVDDDGNEVWTINLDEERAVYKRAEESVGSLLRNFAKAQNARLSLKLHRSKRAADVRVGEAAQKFDLRGALPRAANAADDEVQIDVIGRRPEHLKHNLKIDVRLHVDHSKLVNMSATWNYEPYGHIDVQKTIKALQKFIARATNEAELAEDLLDAKRARDTFAEMAGPVVRYDQESIKGRVAELMNLTAQGVKITPYELQRRRALVYKDFSPQMFSTALVSLSRIVDRRTRVMDLPPVQATGALINALSTNNVDMLSAWLEGDVGYVNGIGFVPRTEYEYYMLQMERERDRWIAGGLRPPDTALSSRRRLPFFMGEYDSYIRSNEERQRQREEVVERLKRKLGAQTRKRHERARMKMLTRTGRWKSEMLDDDANEHTYHMVRRLAPHIHNGRWAAHGVNHEHVLDALNSTRFGKRTLQQRAILKRAVVVVDTNPGTPSFEDILGILDDVIDYVFGKEDVLLGAFNTLVDAAGIAIELLLEWDALSAFIDYLDTFTCTIPNDYAIDGTGTYSLGCALQLFLPEKLFTAFGLWPTDANTGDIAWPDDAFVGGMSTTCTDLPLGFQPSLYCPDGTRIPPYDPCDEQTTTPLDDDDSSCGLEFCMTTRDGSFPHFDSNDPQCETARNFDTFNDDDEGYPLDMPLCPGCAACLREFNSCEELGYGIDPFRVIQVYEVHLEVFWNEALDVENNVFAMFVVLFAAIVYFNNYTVFRLQFFGTSLSFGGPEAFIVLLFMLFLGLFTGLDTWFYSAVFIVFWVIVYEPLSVIFFAYMLWRKLWFLNTATFEAIFEDNTLGPDPFFISYVNLSHAVADLFLEIADFTKITIFGFTFFTLPSPLGFYFPFLEEWADSLQLFRGAGEPTSFENLCSAFGFWFVGVSLFGGALIIYFGYVATLVVISLVTAIGAVGLAILYGLGYLLLLLSLPFLLLFGSRSAVDQADYEIRRDLEEEEQLTRKGVVQQHREEKELRKRVSVLEEIEEEELQRARKSPPPAVPAAMSVMELAASLPESQTLRKRANAGEKLDV